MIQAYAAFEAGGALQPFSYDPGELKADEVEIDVTSCGICHSDLSMIDNEWGFSQYPLVAGHEVVCAADAFNDVRDGLVERFGEPENAGLEWTPLNTVEINEDQATTLFKMIDTLEDNDDVQSVSTNFEVSEDVMQKLSAEI